VITEVPTGRETVPVSYPATILGLTERSAKELEATAPPNADGGPAPWLTSS